MAIGKDKAVLSHESALALLELSDNVPDKVHLLVPRRHRGLRRPSDVVIHTYPDHDEIAAVWRDGMPLTAPARTLVDVADELQPEQAAMAAQQALRLGLLTRQKLEREAIRRRKTHVLKTLLGSHAAR
jgi:predicted transcriptional regulator of viral defense system